MEFNFSTIENFDQHISLSIPNYESLNDIFKNIAQHFVDQQSTLVDIGCSSGRFLESLEKFDLVKYVGVDTVNFGEQRSFEFWQGDAERYFQQENNYVSVIVSMFFLQFLRPTKRRNVLSQIKKRIDAGAIFLISEKVFFDDTMLHELISRMHVQMKRKSFEDKEILDKENEMNNFMFCRSQINLEKELQDLGAWYKVWQSYNFSGYVVTKNGF